MARDWAASLGMKKKGDKLFFLDDWRLVGYTGAYEEGCLALRRGGCGWNHCVANCFQLVTQKRGVGFRVVFYGCSSGRLSRVSRPRLY